MIQRHTFLIALILGICCCASSDAHVTFKKELEKKYPKMKVSCNACHVSGKPKKERNEFGKLFYEELKSEKISATFQAKKKAQKHKEYEKKKMIPLFVKALEKIHKQKQQIDGEDGKKVDGKSYDELIKAGEIKNITLKPEKKDPEEKGSAKKAG